MGSIARAAQQVDLARRVAELEKKLAESVSAALSEEIAAVVARAELMEQRIAALEQKRGPGRPPKSDV